MAMDPSWYLRKYEGGGIFGPPFGGDGGPVQIICDATEGRGGSWSPNGTIVFTPNITESLYRVSEGRSTPQKLTQAKPGWTHRNPYFLPDGEHFLFISREPSGGATAGSLYATSLKGEEPKLLLDHASNVQYSGGYLLYLKDSNLVAQSFDASGPRLSGNPIPVAEHVDYWNARDSAYFSASPTGVLLYRQMLQTHAQPTLVDREGRELGKIGEPGIYQDPKFSRDGSKLALARSGKDPSRFDIWITDIQHNSSSRATLVDSPQLGAAFSPGRCVTHLIRAPMPLRLDFVPMVLILIQLFAVRESQRRSCGKSLMVVTTTSRSPSLSKSPKAHPRAATGAEIPVPAS